jgi:hypothetical protein
MRRLLKYAEPLAGAAPETISPLRKHRGDSQYKYF